MRKKLRPDVASDTSRRNNNCVTTQHQIRRDENEGTNSHSKRLRVYTLHNSKKAVTAD